MSLITKVRWRIEVTTNRLGTQAGVRAGELWRAQWAGFYHHASLVYGAAALLGSKITHCYRHLSYPKGAGPGAIQRAPRHANNPFKTLCWHLHQYLMMILYSRWLCLWHSRTSVQEYNSVVCRSLFQTQQAEFAYLMDHCKRQRLHTFSCDIFIYCGLLYTLHTFRD